MNLFVVENSPGGMFVKTRVMTVFLLIIQLLFAAAYPIQASAEQETPEIQADSAVLMDMKTGQILWAKNADKPHYPASITKILTAILALENSNLDDLVVTPKLATLQEGNRVYLEEGEKIPMRQLLYGLLLQSGNDAAVAIAEHVAGSVPQFAKMMNDKAKEIGAVHSHFVTPNGLHDPDHYTTARDMALIGRYAMQIPTFRQIVGSKTYVWHSQGWQSTLLNLNKMLWTYDGATGVKTGFTDQAHQTIVATAKRGQQEYLVCLMYGLTQQSIRDDASRLLDYGFAHFTTHLLAHKGEAVSTLNYPLGIEIHAVLDRDFYYPLRNGDPAPVEKVIHMKKPIPPFIQGTQVGTVDFVQSGQVLGSVPLLADKGITFPFNSWFPFLLLLSLFAFSALWRRWMRWRLRTRPLDKENYS